MHFITEPAELRIRLEGWERLWALKREVVVPRTDIVDVDFLPKRPIMQDFAGYYRIPGTSIPWRFLAGTFMRKGDREFWYVRMQQEGIMTIELKPKSSSGYDRLRLSTNAETAQVIADWWPAD
ncbi:MAG TPA: hypothetical protein VLI54_05580 [Bacillota bacterium]|nr:hypothetical protein [Bacillota bacterium]